MPWFSPPLTGTSPVESICVTILSTGAEVFDSIEDLKRHPDLGKFASESVIPTGLFTGEGESPRPTLFAIGKILLAVETENQITGNTFWAIRIRTLGGEMWVALPSTAIDRDVTGKWIAVQGAAAASMPLRLPNPIVEEREPTPASQRDEEVEPRLRKLCVEFSQGDSFADYLADIHLSSFSLVLCLLFGVVFKAARRIPRTRGRLTPALTARYRQAAQNAPIVFARVVMANSMLLESGRSSPALVVVAFGDDAENAMDKARGVLSRIHFGRAKTDEEKRLAKEIEDEDYQFGKRRRLPHWLVGDTEAYAADLWVPKGAAESPAIAGGVIPCLAEPGIDGLTAAIPTDLIKKAMKPGPQPPPLPKRG